jgi:ribonuclease HI
MAGKIKVYSDGGSRGNPGPAACAFVVYKDNDILFKNAVFLGRTTNNIAEYNGVLSALNWLSKNKDKIGEGEIEFFLDSELVVKQLTGAYRVKNSLLKNLFVLVKEKEKEIGKDVLYRHVYREKNKLADLLLNNKLDFKD